MKFPLHLQSIVLDDESIELFVPDRESVKTAYHQGLIFSPYWCQVWPAARSLAQFLLYHPSYTEDKKVVELGAGLGLPSIIAARNAASVLCSDVSPEAVSIVRATSAHAGLSNLYPKIIDWNTLPEDLQADVLLLSDVNYEPAAFENLQQILNHFLQKGTTVLLSTPQRLMAKDFVRYLLPWKKFQEEMTVVENGQSILTTIFVLQKDPAISKTPGHP